MNLPPLSLYVHLPWCVRKCPYCDFNSHRAGDSPPKKRYLEALEKDLQRDAVLAPGREITSVFLGGGTPSLFSPDEIATLLGAVKTCLPLAADAEVTMEANPGTVECGSPAGYRDAGVTRLSVGAQSFDDTALAALGRIHTSADISRAVEDAHGAGFDNLNIDLMHGLPAQTVSGAMDDLTKAMELEPSHISWYHLTLEPNTVFHARPPENLPDDELAFEIQDAGQALLEANGFEHYEVSAFARDGRRCRHNLNYWQFGDYLAIGAGAHGKLTTAQSVVRYRKPANPLQYMMSCEEPGSAVQTDSLNPADRLFEFMLNGLRLTDGFAESLFVERTGLPAKALVNAAAPALSKKLIERSDDGWWQPTPLGRRFLNDLQAVFLVEDD